METLGRKFKFDKTVNLKSLEQVSQISRIFKTSLQCKIYFKCYTIHSEHAQSFNN